jgi:hypothetical protein
MSLIFFAAILPPLIIMIAWAGITAFRIYFPERTLPFDPDPVWMHQHALSVSEGALVGAQDIRNEQRRQSRLHAPGYRYDRSCSGSSGMPDDWADDLWLRRN